MNEIIKLKMEGDNTKTVYLVSSPVFEAGEGKPLNLYNGDEVNAISYKHFRFYKSNSGRTNTIFFTPYRLKNIVLPSNLNLNGIIEELRKIAIKFGVFVYKYPVKLISFSKKKLINEDEEEVIKWIKERIESLKYLDGSIIEYDDWGFEIYNIIKPKTIEAYAQKLTEQGNLVIYKLFSPQFKKLSENYRRTGQALITTSVFSSEIYNHRISIDFSNNQYNLNVVSPEHQTISLNIPATPNTAIYLYHPPPKAD
jgi:hypothetical protein